MIRYALLDPAAGPDEVDEFVRAILGDEPRHLSLKHDQTMHGKWATGSETLSAPSDMDFLTPADRKRVEARMETLAEYGREHGTPGFATTPDAMAAETLKVAARATPEEIAAGKKWYADAHDDCVKVGAETGYGTTKAAAVTARCSPNREWEGNRELAAAIMRTNAADAPYTIDQDTYDKLRVKKLANGKDLPGPGVYRPSELDPLADAFANPVYQAMNLPGKMWTTQVASSTRILRGPDDMSTIEVELGGPKVRNFYNNIRHPEDPVSVTIDSHQVRAMQPDGIQIGFRKGSTVTTDNAPSTFFSSQPGGSVKDKTLEGIGTYPVFAAGMQLATQQYNQANGTNLTPSQLQAITWIVQRRENP